MINKEYIRGPQRPATGIFRPLLPSSSTIYGVYLRHRFGYKKAREAYPGQSIALSYVREFVTCAEKPVYIVARNPHWKRTDELRAKGGLLADKPALKKQSHRDLEVNYEDGSAELMSVVDLDGFSFENDAGTILDFVNSIMVVADSDIDWVADRCRAWVPRNRSISFLFDHDRMAKDIARFESFSFVRYYSGDNAYDEELVAIGNVNFVSSYISSCFLKVREQVREEWLRPMD